MHKLLTEHPVYQRAVEEVARIRGAQYHHQQQHSQAQAAYSAASAEYQQAAIEALREGREAPVRPVPPEVDPDLVQRLALDSINAPGLIREAERRLAPELLPKLEARAFEVEESIREFADTMRALAREASELRVTAATHRTAAELPPLVNADAVDVAALVDLVVHGDRLLAAESPSYSEVAGFDLDAPRGFQRVRSFNVLGGRR